MIVIVGKQTYGACFPVAATTRMIGTQFTIFLPRGLGLDTDLLLLLCRDCGRCLKVNVSVRLFSSPASAFSSPLPFLVASAWSSHAAELRPLRTDRRRSDRANVRAVMQLFDQVWHVLKQGCRENSSKISLPKI